jgi:hypothetical protein
MQKMQAGVSLLALSVASSVADAATDTYSFVGAIVDWTVASTGTYTILAPPQQAEGIIVQQAKR